jgi:hypothetical protein
MQNLSNADKQMPSASNKQYHIMIDRDSIKVEKTQFTGREILTLAGKVPVERFQLNMKSRGKTTVVQPDQVIDITEPGLEKFVTMPLDQTEGERPVLRRQFTLPEEDMEYLDSLGNAWEAIENGGRWLLVHDFKVPDGYNHKEVTLTMRIEGGYPTAQIDMIYVHPALARIDGQPIGALAQMIIDGKAYQRWSRHRTGQNPWRPGLDNLSTHIPLAEFWFKQEFIKRPPYAIPA